MEAAADYQRLFLVAVRGLPLFFCPESGQSIFYGNEETINLLSRMAAEREDSPKPQRQNPFISRKPHIYRR